MSHTPLSRPTHRRREQCDDSRQRCCVEVIVNHAPNTDSHSNAAERERREAALDDTIEQSFPASDPPSSNPNPDTHDAITRETFGDDTPHPTQP
jgi:hypothetical protein